MKIVFYSNYLNHHQLPLCLALYRRLGDDFVFVAGMSVPAFRLSLGYEDMNERYPFVVRAYENEESERYARQLAETSDVVIVGSAKEEYIDIRARNRRLAFRYMERVFKDGFWKSLNPHLAASLLYHHTRLANRPIYMLCASSYTKQDMNRFGAYVGKCYKWGYFPEVQTYESFEKLQQGKREASILWVGRMIPVKHVEAVAVLAQRLRAAGAAFSIDVIGDGEQRPMLEHELAEHGLTAQVHVHGAMPPEQVRAYMERSEIFIFTSDHAEGWGAVVNEAMNSGCAVVGSDAAGSVPYLIRDNVNGCIFRSGHWDELISRVNMLLGDREKRESMARNAYQTMLTLWNADAAAQRLIDLSRYLLGGKPVCFDEGPCSKA